MHQKLLSLETSNQKMLAVPFFSNLFFWRGYQFLATPPNYLVGLTNFYLQAFSKSATSKRELSTANISEKLKTKSSKIVWSISFLNVLKI
jgi:hypothetical protein